MALTDAANNEAMVSLSPVLTKRKRPPEDIDMSLMELRTQAMRDARDMKKAKIDALNVAVCCSLECCCSLKIRGKTY